MKIFSTGVLVGRSLPPPPIHNIFTFPGKIRAYTPGFYINATFIILSPPLFSLHVPGSISKIPVKNANKRKVHDANSWISHVWCNMAALPSLNLMATKKLTLGQLSNLFCCVQQWLIWLWRSGKCCTTRTQFKFCVLPSFLFI